MDLSRNLRLIMSHAYNKAREENNEYLMPEHILYSIVSNDNEIVEKLGVDSDAIMSELDSFFVTKVPLVKDGNTPIESMGFSQVIQAAIQQVENSARDIVEVGDIMVSLFDANGQANYILQKNHVNRELILESVSDLQRGDDNPAPESNSMNRKKKSMLAEFCTELVAKAAAGEIDPIIGRDEEIERTVQILCRKKKNNPIHVGEPGVGKCLHKDEKIDLLVSDELYEQLKEFI